MVIGLLISVIGFIPIALALSIHKMYNKSKLSLALFVYMLLITVWQLDVGVLYLSDQWNESASLFLFRLLRLGPTYAIPVVFNIAYIIIKHHSTVLYDAGKLETKICKFLFKKITFYILIALSSFVYLINFTNLGISGLQVAYLGHSNISYYYVKYGPLSWIYVLYMSTFILFMFLIFHFSKQIQSLNIRHFLKAFSIYSFLLFVTGFLNFSHDSSYIASSIGTVIFSTLIMLEFLELNTHIKMNYSRLVERQKKLDYTGSLAGSLIHEVKNTNQIIKGFSKISNKSETMTENEKSSLDMIIKATDYFSELTNSYREYMETSQMTFKRENLDDIIHNAIELSKESLKEHHVEIEIINPYNSLEGFVNRTYFRQIFINLIKNSIEAFSEEQKGKKITIEIQLVESNIVIHFIDTGKGIPAANWKSVFDPFISFKKSGMGLGLPFVKKVILEHLGDIQIVESTPKGTHFQIELPQNGVINMD
ncbi:HAMP domain-containing sensor histidine kinase [Neobacillus sp. PS3-12]|uniref:sensor histidine kinase n=1 Tax=Neobacillus sp. PS3-12 TaxID=3070677 RepID=UPI0027DFDF6B|nr:HAMP domain-containing sensor histidine kinase [Neobacillus sp. PS3-12]WML52206.1 HAMP domain-containing sensor histidine kinase [Neobacillus sp. PS3-12]